MTPKLCLVSKSDLSVECKIIASDCKYDRLHCAFNTPMLKPVRYLKLFQSDDFGGGSFFFRHFGKQYRTIVFRSVSVRMTLCRCRVPIREYPKAISTIKVFSAQHSWFGFLLICVKPRALPFSRGFMAVGDAKRIRKTDL